MLTKIEKEIVKEFQEDLPVCSHPFKKIADRIGISEKELLAKIEEMKSDGIIRRFGVIISHRKAGYVANAMVVWRVSEERIRKVGTIMASFEEVSHCYQRATTPDWQYNLFSMIHGKSEDECNRIIKIISEKVQIEDYRKLISTRELKKTSMKYFQEDRK